MSKHCKYCNIELLDNKPNCPLCGKCIDEPLAKSGNYQNGQFPIYSTKHDKVEPVCNVLIKILLLCVLVCCIADLFFTGSMFFSIIVIISAIYAILVILIPIKNRITVPQFFNRLAFFTPFLILAIELFSQSWGWGICIVSPALWFAIALASQIMMVSKGYIDYEMLTPTISISTLTVIQLIFLYSFHQSTTATAILFIIELVVILLTFMFKTKKSIHNLKKKYRA